MVQEVAAAWGQVKSLAKHLDGSIDEPTTDAALDRFRSCPVDGYDLFTLETMGCHGVIQVITDDGDFATVPGVRVFTANRNVIQRAQNAGRLVKRQ